MRKALHKFTELRGTARLKDIAPFVKNVSFIERTWRWICVFSLHFNTQTPAYANCMCISNICFQFSMSVRSSQSSRSLFRWSSTATSSFTAWRAAVRSTSPIWLLAASRYVRRCSISDSESCELNGAWHSNLKTWPLSGGFFQQCTFKHSNAVSHHKCDETQHRSATRPPVCTQIQIC